MKMFLNLALALGVLASSPAFAQSRCTKNLLVMVPGYFNLFRHQTSEKPGNRPLRYFSQEILAAAASAGFQPVVIEDLDTLGDVQKNGTQLGVELESLAAAHPGCAFTILGHSAGGLYTALALTQHPDIPVKKIITIGTPWEGSDVMRLVKKVPNWETLLDWYSLDAARDFDPATIAALLASFRVPEVPWITISAQQEPCLLLSCNDARRMNWAFSLPWAFSDQAGDGMVSVASAAGRSARLSSGRGPISVENWSDLVIPLDHAKTVIDSDFFLVVGELNVGWIADTQSQYFTEIFRRLARR
jgi:pimeloyl-ACP methyl ester carboxylesterase